MKTYRFYITFPDHSTFIDEQGRTQSEAVIKLGFTPKHFTFDGVIII